jgi:hypothetical protein
MSNFASGNAHIRLLSSLFDGDDESLSAKGPLVGLFSKYKSMPPQTLREAMVTIFDAARDGHLPDADIDVLEISIGIVLDAAEYQIATKGPPTPDITVDLLAALKLYTYPIEPEETVLYYLVNKALRSEDRSVVKPFTGIIWLIMKGLKSLPAFEDTVIFRGVKKNLSSQYIKGTKVTWSAFSSCTSTLEVRRMFNAFFF